MSRKERDRLKVMGPLAEDRLKQVKAARLLRLSVGASGPACGRRMSWSSNGWTGRSNSDGRAAT